MVKQQLAGSGCAMVLNSRPIPPPASSTKRVARSSRSMHMCEVAGRAWTNIAAVLVRCACCAPGRCMLHCVAVLATAGACVCCLRQQEKG